MICFFNAVLLRCFFGVSGCSIYHSASDTGRKVPCKMKACIFLHNRCLDIADRSPGKFSGIKALLEEVKSHWSPKPILGSDSLLLPSVSDGVMATVKQGT